MKLIGKKKRILRNAILICGLIVLTLLVLSETSMGPYRRRLERYLARVKLESVNPFSSHGKDRILIIAPHPDDETISSAGIIQNALENEDKVHVVIVTNGDGFGNVLDETVVAKFRSGDHGVHIGYTRQQESIRALEKIGLSRNNITFLGFPDSGLSKIWFENWKDPFFSIHTKSNMSPYDNSFTLNVPYQGKSLSADFAKILEEFHPTIIVTPSIYDFHPDHVATTNFVIAEMEKLRILSASWIETTKVYYYLVHHGKLRWPRPWGYNPEETIAPPESLSKMNTKWFHLSLDSEKTVIKKNAMDQYTSQIKLIGDYMYAFVRSEELFGSHEWNTNIILDPTDDYVTKDLIRGADFVSLEVNRVNNQLNLKMATFPKGLPGSLTYLVKIVFYEKLDMGEIKETRKQLTFHRSDLVINGNMVEANIAIKDFPNLYGCFLTVESFPRNTPLMLDKIPWSFFRLK